MLILASQSATKHRLFHQIGARCEKPPVDQGTPTHDVSSVGGSPHGVSTHGDIAPKEPPSFYVQRRAREKIQRLPAHCWSSPCCATARALSIGTRILGPMTTPEAIDRCLGKLSGRRHRLYTAIALRLPSGAFWTRLCITRVTLQALDSGERALLARALPWHQGPLYDPTGVMGAFIRSMQEEATGSFDGVPLGPTYRLLKSHGLITHPPFLSKESFLS